MTSLLSTGKKKAKASRVFGGDVFDEAETSLWYSPSPRKTSLTKSSHEDNQTDPSPIALFPENEPRSHTKTISSDDLQKENISENLGTSFQSIKDSELSRLRATKSPLRRNLAEKTEVAIQNAITSVSETLNANVPSKSPSKVHKNQKKKAVAFKVAKQAKSVRFQWDEHNEETRKFYNKVEENRRQLLALQRQLASAHFQQKAQERGTERLQRIAEMDKQLEFNSTVFRDHQKKLKEERDKKRKISMDARAKLRVNKRAGEEKMDTMRRKEELAIFEVRSDLHRARMEAKKVNSEERRKSFQFRTGDAKRIRDMRLKWQHKQQVEREKSFELTRGAAKDVAEYKVHMSKERRESLQNRNQDARRRRNQEREDMYAAMRAEHESYELKWAGEKDAEEYQKKMREERRKSLANRNKESFRHAQVMNELRALTIEKEAESFMLKFAAENDAKAYLKKLADERRESLQLRGQEARRQRKYEEEQAKEAIDAALTEGKLQSECQKDVENYKKCLAERSRKSLQFRAKEAMARRLGDENRTRQQQSQDHAAFELESLARMDVEEYLKDCKRRRRQSLASRAKEKRRHEEWKRRQHEQEIAAQQESGRLQSLNYQYMALAQQQERARLALDALRSAGCKIKGNPFGGLLGDM